MNTLNRLHNSVFARFDRAEWLLPLLARLVFAGVLLTYFWASGLTKLGDGIGGIFTP